MNDPCLAFFLRHTCLPRIEKGERRLDGVRDLAPLAGFDLLALLECGVDHILQIRGHGCLMQMALDVGCLPRRGFVKAVLVRKRAGLQ